MEEQQYTLVNQQLVARKGDLSSLHTVAELSLRSRSC